MYSFRFSKQQIASATTFTPRRMLSSAFRTVKEESKSHSYTRCFPFAFCLLGVALLFFMPTIAAAQQYSQQYSKQPAQQYTLRQNQSFTPRTVPQTLLAPVQRQVSVRVSGSNSWTSTGLQLAQGEVVTIQAQGAIQFRKRKYFDDKTPTETGPQGSYLYSDSIIGNKFPLPSTSRGPAPPYSLIARIENGKPFYIGPHKSFHAPTTGRLFLGINDFDCSDNEGSFLVRLEQGGPLRSFKQETVVTANAAPGSPVPDCHVMVFYVDGLRPDVVREMVAMGHLPNINRLFVSGGTWLSRNCTAFPSDTITSNGTMWTGCFSDRHGLKGQVRFSRRKLVSESYLEPLGPSRSARLLKPQGLDGAIHRAQAASLNKLKGEAASTAFQGRNMTGVQPLFGHLRAQGTDWATGILPMMTDVPPLLWTRSIVREMPMMRSHESWKYVDDANTHYTLRNLMHRDRPVTIVWLPETDSVSHKKSRGQFGITRRTIAEADYHIGRIVSELVKQKKFDKTYFILVSDHGHHGGRQSHLRHYDLANEFFHQPRKVSSTGHWVGGGMGMSVRQHRFWNRHPEDRPQDFVFIDGDSDGAARIYLPRKHFHSGDWMGQYKPGPLFAYPLKQGQPPVNLINAILSAKTQNDKGQRVHPIDLVMVRLNSNSILISTVDRGQAVIKRQQDQNGKWNYSYTVVTNVRPEANGSVSYNVVQNPVTDPLHLLNILTANRLGSFYTERNWLRITADSIYPDAVVTLTRHMLWQKNLAYREPEFAPDLVVTARRGWYFGHRGSKGTMHGYPFADATKASFFVSGPNIHRGARIEEPSRLTDLTPTILDMVGMNTAEHEFDGIPLRQIYATGSAAAPAIQQTAAVHSQTTQMGLRQEPLYWNKLDLNAWNSLSYQEKGEYQHLPKSINRPNSAWDLNNMAYNLITVSDWNVLKLFDDILSPLSSQRPKVLSFVETADQNVRSESRSWISEGAHALDIPSATLGDYNITSQGNMQRINRAVDWFQNRGKDLDKVMASPLGRESLPGTNLVHTGIDSTQDGVWEVYRFGQRVVVQVLDENLLNSMENNTDKMLNRFSKVPAEIVLTPQQSRGLQIVNHHVQDPNLQAAMIAKQKQIEANIKRAAHRNNSTPGWKTRQKLDSN